MRLSGIDKTLTKCNTITKAYDLIQSAQQIDTYSGTSETEYKIRNGLDRLTPLTPTQLHEIETNKIKWEIYEHILIFISDLDVDNTPRL